MANTGLMLGAFFGIFLLSAAHWGLAHWRIVNLASLAILPFVIARQWRGIDRLAVATGSRLERRTAAG